MKNPQVLEEQESKKDKTCPHGLKPTFRNYCPQCVLTQLKNGGGTPLTKDLLNYISQHPKLHWYDAAIAYWTGVSNPL